jgi:mannan endo-1,4-beta-mannosidase
VTKRPVLAFLAGLALSAALAGCGSFMSEAAGVNGTGPNAQATRGTSANSLPYDISGLLDPRSGKFLGVEAPGASGSLAPVVRFAHSVGRRPNIVGQYVAWNTPFAAQSVTRAWSYGALSYLAWEPFDVSVQSIAQGHSDAYITQFAKAVRALNLPIALSFGHEMNGNWYPWGTKQTTPAEFVAAWRRVHDLFIQAGATNVLWVWNPNDIYPVPQVQLKPYYPGNAYVDWIGITGYVATTGPHTYADLYAPTITEIRSFTAKPFIIAETSVETGPGEVASAQQLITRTVADHADVLGLIWFDYNKGGVDWRVESRPILQAAVARNLARLQLSNVKQR